MRLPSLLLPLLLLIALAPAGAAGPPIRKALAERPIAQLYEPLKKALAAQQLFVVFEVDMGANLARFAERWGADYNRNHLDGLRSLVFCNGWLANRVGNADPDALALCPLKLTLVEKDGHTRALYVSPVAVTAGSPAQPVARELQRRIDAALQAAGFH